MQAVNREFGMGHSQAEKARNRERILAEAARQIRQDGLESVSVGPLMARVGLTHGGFYGHFESREALLAEALARAIAESRAKVGASMSPSEPRFGALVSSYLSRTHRDSRESGCAIAALGADVARAGDTSRELLTGQIESFIRSTTEALDGDEPRAILAVSAMVGALTLARIVPGERSDAILKAVRAELDRLEAGGPD